MSTHIKERVTWGAAKKELMAHMCKWDMAFPRVTEVRDHLVTNDRSVVWRPERLNLDEMANRCNQENVANTCTDDEGHGESEDEAASDPESDAYSSLTTECLPNTSPPKRQRRA